MYETSSKEVENEGLEAYSIMISHHFHLNHIWFIDTS